MADTIAIITQQTFPLLCAELAERDKDLHALLQQYGLPPFWTRQQGFASLVHMILEQQVSLASAAAAFARLGDRLRTITPENLLTMTDEEMKACAFSRQKTVYARALAMAIADGSLPIDRLDTLPDDEVIRLLTAVKGIGYWTADIYLMMALQRTDRFPIGDIALVQSMKQVKGLPADATAADMLAIAETWRPNRTVAAYMLWHAYLSRKKRT